MTLIPQPKGRLTADAGFGVASDSAQPYGRRWLFTFTAYGRVRVLVVGADPSLEDALEIAAAWLAKHAPGTLVEPDYKAAAEKLGAPDDDCEGISNGGVAELAEADLTYTESGWIPSWKWTVDENPSRETLLRLDGRS